VLNDSCGDGSYSRSPRSSKPYAPGPRSWYNPYAFDHADSMEESLTVRTAMVVLIVLLLRIGR
jgi:hypothetical protein